MHAATRVLTIEVLYLECVLGHVTGVKIENKNALINRPCWICLRSIGNATNAETKYKRCPVAKTVRFLTFILTM